MAVPKYPNSAGRLLALFGAIQPKNNVTQQLISKLLNEKNPPNTSASEFPRFAMRAFGELHAMYSQFRDDMEAADVNDEQRKVLLNGLTALDEVVYPNQLNASPRHLTEAEKSLLEVCATILPQEGIPAKDDISQIRDSISALREEVEAADTSPTLRKILLELIRLSEDAINRFNNHGARGLKKAFKGMLAEVAELYFTASKKEKDEIKETTTWATITSHLKRFDELAGKLMKYRPMLEHAGTFLLGQ